MKMKIISALAACSISTAFAANPQRIADVLNSLDLNRPELAEIAGAMRKKDLKQAKKCAAALFRKQLIEQNKSNQPGIVDFIHSPARPCNKRTAMDAVKGKVKVVGVYHTFPDGKIDWLFNPSKAPGMAPDHEWLWQLNRMAFWADMAAYYQLTGETLYAQRIVEQFRSWVNCQPCPGEQCNVKDSVWRTIECGIRLGISWPQVFQRIAAYPGLTDDDILLYMSSNLEQMRHLLAYYRRSGGNWLTMEMNGVYTFASDFPQFKESSAARSRAVELLYADLQKQILPDGIQYELSPGYHFVTVCNAMAIFVQAQKRGFLNEIPKDFSKLLERGFEGMTKMAMPNRNNPAHNDCGPGPLAPNYQKCRKLFPDNKLINWMADGAPAKDPRCPAAASNLLPWCGFVIMRSSWAKNANALFFDGGPLGRAHTHQDKLNLILHGYGEELLYDDGGGFYEESLFRYYGCSAWDHSVIAVDHLPQCRECVGENRIPTVPPKVIFETTPKFDYAEAVYDQGFGDEMKRIATHTRQVLFLKPDLFIVCDRLVPHDDKVHHYEARWQVDTLKMRELLPGVLCSTRNTANLVIAPLDSDKLKVSWVSGKTGKTLSEMGGLYIGYKVRPWRPAVTVSHERTGKGEQLFLTMLHPVRKGNTKPVQSIKRTGTQTFEIKFNDGRCAVVTIKSGSALDVNYCFWGTSNATASL